VVVEVEGVVEEVGEVVQHQGNLNLRSVISCGQILSILQNKVQTYSIPYSSFFLLSSYLKTKR